MIGGPIGRPIGGIIASDGTVFTQTLTASCSASAGLSRSTGKIISPAVLASVTIPRAISKIIAPVCSGTVTVNKEITATLAVASATATAHVIKSVGKDVGTAVIKVSSSMVRSAGKIVVPVVNASVSFKRDIAKIITATVTGTATAGRGFAITLTASVRASSRLLFGLIPRERIAKVLVTVSGYFATAIVSAGYGEADMTGATGAASVESGKALIDIEKRSGSAQVDAAN